MKNTMRKLTAFLAAAVLLMTASFALADTKITVTGNGETQVSADTAIVSLGVSARDKDVLKAQQEVNRVIAAIRESLIAKGVAEENINTDYMNIYAIYDYNEDQEQIKAYNASSTLAIKVTKMDDVGAVIDEAFAAGANTLNGITFSASNTDEARSESMKAAVAEARTKAEVLAEAAGMKITGIKEISEGGVFSYDNTVGNFSAKSMDREEAADITYGTVVQAAKLLVTASVTIIFEAE
ncbi:MAG: SIMPL domain-containing protein [Clostridia bacterium]|nr:SIMPL domain-containing protein [Clostridia bacterium]